MAKTRRNRKAETRNARKQEGGKRKGSRKGNPAMREWNKKVMGVYKELKAKNPNTKLGEAMREASLRKKRGDL